MSEQPTRSQAEQERDREQAKLLRLFIAVLFGAAHVAYDGNANAAGSFAHADRFIAEVGLKP